MQKETTEKKKKRKGWKIALCIALVFIFTVCMVLQAGSWYTEYSWNYWHPDYEQTDIRSLLLQRELSDEEYELLYRQTGLGRSAIDDMKEDEDGRRKILRIQELFFTDIEVDSRLFAPFTYMDEIEGNTSSVLCDLRDGDIIVSATTRVSWWRYGHAAIVVNGRQEIIAECVAPGTISEIASARAFDNLVNFLVLRPKIPQEIKTQVANYVLTEQMGIPYRLTTGILTKKYPEKLEFSQCAHFVWYAYKKFGYDLDSNGGGLVKAQDMACSPHVEVVQAFGFDLDRLWS